MPVIPGPDQIQRTVIQPGSRVTQYQGGVAEAAGAQAAQIEGQAAAGVYRAIGGLADKVGDTLRAEQDRIEGLKVAAAVTENRQQTLLLVSKYKGTRGGGVLDEGYLAGQIAGYDAQSAALEGELNTPRQREAFDRAAKDDRVGFSSGLMAHALSESDKYTKTVRDAILTTDRATAAAQYDDKKVVTARVANTVETVNGILDYEGITDPKVRAATVLEHVGALHAAVVDAAVDANDPADAEEYLRANKASMTPEQARALAGRIKPVAEYAEAVSLADTAGMMQKEGKSPEAVQDYITHATKTRSVANMAQDILRAKAQAAQVTSDTASGQLLTKFYDGDGPSLGKAIAIRNSPEFKGVSESERGRLYEHLRQQGGLADSRGREKADEKWQSPTITAAFLDAINDPNLISKSQDQINNLVLTLGPTHTKQVMAEYKSQKSGVAKFNISKEILNEGIPLDLREKRESAPSEAKRQESIAAFKGLVESGLQTFKEAQKRLPSDTEQAAIVLAARRTIVTPGSWFGRFGSTDETPIYKLPKEQRDALTAADRKAAMANQARSMPESEFRARLIAQAKREGKSPSQAVLDSAWNKFSKGK